MKGKGSASDKTAEKLKSGLLHSSVVDLTKLTVGQRIQVVVREIDELRGRVALTPHENVDIISRGSNTIDVLDIETTNSVGKKRKYAVDDKGKVKFVLFYVYLLYVDGLTLRLSFQHGRARL
jgi:hypothetical protein